MCPYALILLLGLICFCVNPKHATVDALARIPVTSNAKASTSPHSNRNGLRSRASPSSLSSSSSSSSSSLDGNHLALIAELGAAAGIYQTASRSAADDDATLSKIVIATISNFGYIRMLRNFECFMDRLQLKALVFSLDEETHRYIKSKHKHSQSGKIHSKERKKTDSSSAVEATLPLYSHRWFPHDPNTYGLDKSPAQFRSARFHNISCSKFAVVYTILDRGFDVFYIDIDIALVRDPFPLLIKYISPSIFSRDPFSDPNKSTPTEPRAPVDFIHSVNALCPKSRTWTFDSEEEGNTGLFFVRANIRTKNMFKIASNLSHHYSNLDDQTIFWQTVRYCRNVLEDSAANRRQEHATISGLRTNKLDHKSFCKFLNFEVRGECSSPKIKAISGSDIAISKAAPSSEPNPEPESVTAVNRNKMSKMTGISTCHLDGCMFSSGALRLGEGVSYKWLMSALRGSNPNQQKNGIDSDYKLYSVHANYLMGLENKIAALRRYGYWLTSSEPSVEGNSSTCIPFTPP